MQECKSYIWLLLPMIIQINSRDFPNISDHLSPILHHGTNPCVNGHLCDPHGHTWWLLTCSLSVCIASGWLSCDPLSCFSIEFRSCSPTRAVVRCRPSVTSAPGMFLFGCVCFCGCRVPEVRELISRYCCAITCHVVTLLAQHKFQARAISLHLWTLQCL